MAMPREENGEIFTDTQSLGSRAVRALVRQLSSPHKYYYNLNLVLFYFSDPISRNESDSFHSNLNFLHLHFEFASQG